MIYSSAECFSGPLETEKLVITCPVDTYITKVISAGLIALDNPIKHDCLFKEDSCSSFLRKDELIADISKSFG